MPPLIFLTRKLPFQEMDRLAQSGFRVVAYRKDQIIPRSDLLKSVKGASAIVPILTDRMDAQLMDAAGPSLKIIANYAVGFDNVDLAEAKKRGIAVTNTPCDEVNEAVAEHAFALMIALARRISEADTFAKAKKYSGWSPTLMLGSVLAGKTLGIIGAGRIGSSLARHAVHGFGMNLVYSDAKRNRELEKELNATSRSMEQLLEVSDFVSVHVPLLPSTRHLISTDAFSLMKKTAFLINTARGPVVDEKALLRALRTKRIAGAALDVFEAEPAIDCDVTDNLELKSFPNVILTPHIGSATIEAREAMSKLVVNNILAVLAGKPPQNPAG